MVFVIKCFTELKPVLYLLTLLIMSRKCLQLFSSRQRNFDLKCSSAVLFLFLLSNGTFEGLYLTSLWLFFSLVSMEHSSCEGWDLN